MKLYLGADHRGFKLKAEIKEWLEQATQHQVIDLGNTEFDQNDDYPDFSLAVAEAVAEVDDANLARGIVLCGSGVGVTIAGNKVVGARVAGLNSEAEVVAARQDDDLNVLALGADFLELDQIKNLITSFLETEYQATDRHQRRLDKIRKYETYDRS